MKKSTAKGSARKSLSTSTSSPRKPAGKGKAGSKAAAGSRSSAELAATVAAIHKSQAVIEFNTDGVVLDANENFCKALGYTLDEIRGRHHRMFCEPTYAASTEYEGFWAKLRRGEFDAGVYRRLGKGGREIWVQASYNPILDASGRVQKVVKFAADVTEQKMRAAEFEGKHAAIDKAQAVIEFNLDGSVITANENFCRAVGYSLDEIRGRHHRMFCDPALVQSPEYEAFWAKLRRGEFDAAIYRRLGRGGKEIWIQASYNPIFDPSGRVYKVVKFATDVTEQKRATAEFEGKLAAIDKAQATIEFNLDGTVLTANANFLKTLGYSLDEIRGRHHRMFCEPTLVQSPEYEAFWAKLRRGEFDAGVYRRLGKDNKEIWIQASYNPIVDAGGRVYKVVKFATDISEQKRSANELAQLMSEVQGVMGGVATGDLSRLMAGSYKAGLEETKGSINVAVDKLRELVTELTDGAGTITTAASDISSGNNNLNKRTQEQASALEETAASIEEMTATIKQNANNATQANQLAAGARDSAEKGGQVVGDAVKAMGAITESSKKVSDIIGVIEQIAFQTNMLALNAAVEAARAGDQGRGFAVVAAEVRSLAQRSAAAAKEIRALIQDSSEKVAQGAQLVNRSGETLSEIVGSVKKVSDIIAEITSASEEQASGIDQINSAVAQMDKATQQNAAMVEEAAAAAQSLSEQARGMSQLVSFFRIDGSAAAVTTRKPAAPRAEAAKAAPKRKDTGNGAPASAKSASHDDPEWKEF